VPQETKPPVYLLDTMSFIFRAYHAMQRSRPMSTRTGLPTAAIYVFVNMIKKLRQDFDPLYLAAVFDVSGEVFRDEKAREIGTLRKWSAKSQSFEEVEYAGYKAHREAMPEDLRRQIPYIRRSLEALRIPILEAEGFEADDVIGTLARKAAAEGHPVFIVSGDKDMMQLVTDQVHMLNPQKDNLILDPAKVVEVLGVPPEQVVDVMALRGDTVDNVPGAPGIGDKGSVELIQQFGSVEAVLDRASEVKRKSYRESLEQNRAAVLLSKELVTIDSHVPLDLNLAEMETQAPDVEASRALFTELEFTTMLRELSANPVAKSVSTASSDSLKSEKSVAHSARLIEEPTAEECAAFFIAARKNGFSFVLESALSKNTASGAKSESGGTEAGDGEEETPQQNLSLLDLMDAAGKDTTVYLGVCSDPELALRLPITDEVSSLLKDASIPKQTHDLKTTLHALAAQQISLRGVVDDTMLLSYALNPTHSTQTLADVAARAGLSAPNTASGAASSIHTLVSQLKDKLESANLNDVYTKIDLPLAPVLFNMEQVGVRIDVNLLGTLSMRFATEIHCVGEEIYKLAGKQFNINSPKQLGEVLFKDLGLTAPGKSGKSKSFSTAQDVLEQLAEESEVPRMVLDYRHLSKLKSNYIDALPLLIDSESRVHTTFNAAATATGRLSSTNPNLQNIPIRTELGREIRAAFVSAPGNVMLSADYSQIELRLMAHFSEDPLLVRAYKNNDDIHRLTASEVFGIAPDQMDKTTRNRAKAVNFGIVYGISPFGLAAQLGIPQQEARAYIDRYFARYVGVKAFIERTLEQTRRDGSVRTLFGRIRPIPDIQSRNPNQRGFAERTAINTPLQGTAADLIKLAMIAIAKELDARKLKTHMVLQVHDELLFEVPEGEKSVVAELVRSQMEQVVELKVPLIADLSFGPNWRDLNAD
jgi:DNA polymerase I